MVIGSITRGARFLLVGPLDVWLLHGSESQVLLLLLPLMYGFELIVSPTPRWTKHINHSLVVSCFGGFRPASMDRKKQKL
jgi:hypothetical protein